MIKGLTFLDPLILMLAFGLAMDSCSVAIASSLSYPSFQIYQALKIAVFFGFFQGIMPIIGWLVGSSILGMIAQYDHWVAFGLLLVTRNTFSLLLRTFSLSVSRNTKPIMNLEKSNISTLAPIRIYSSVVKWDCNSSKFIWIPFRLVFPHRSIFSTPNRYSFPARSRGSPGYRGCARSRTCI